MRGESALAERYGVKVHPPCTEAWVILLACQGQLRLAPSGHVIGIDIDAALKMGAARSYDLAVLSELLPAAEAGLLEALCSNRVRDGGP